MIGGSDRPRGDSRIKRTEVLVISLKGYEKIVCGISQDGQPQKADSESFHDTFNFRVLSQQKYDRRYLTFN